MKPLKRMTTRGIRFYFTPDDLFRFAFACFGIGVTVGVAIMLLVWSA